METSSELKSLCLVTKSDGFDWFFSFGISYHGAAQAASGNKEQVSRYREKGKQLFQSIGLFGKTNNGYD